MRKVHSLLSLAFVVTLVIAVPLSANSQTVTPFDPTGSTSTFPASINPAGAITGFYSDASFVNHGFLRGADGTITTFDPSGSTSTMPAGINPEGDIVGSYTDANAVSHGFLRTEDGTITSFDAPGAGTGLFQGTNATSINPAGTITGYYADASYANHGFVRAADGSFTKFDVGSQGTFPTNISSAGEITGNYLFELGTSGFYVPRGFLRAANGTITVNIDPANTFTSNPGGINPNGTIAGYYQDDIAGAWHFFLRSKGGVLTTFDVPGTRQIFSATLNQGQTVIGTYPDASFVIHSFLRTAHGAVTAIDAPDAGTSFFQGTFVSGINSAGMITGHYTDMNYAAHGFVWGK